MSEHTETKPSTTAAPPTAVAAAGQKPAAKVSAESKAAVEPDKMRRRLIWACIWGYLGVNFLMFLRFFFPRKEKAQEHQKIDAQVTPDASPNQAPPHLVGFHGGFALCRNFRCGFLPRRGNSGRRGSGRRRLRFSVFRHRLRALPLEWDRER